MTLFARFCPASVVILNMFSRSLLLTFIGVVSVSDYGSKYQQDYHHVRNNEPFSRSEVMLSILFLAQFMYEIGYLIERGFVSSYYVNEWWTIIDAIDYVMGVVWFILRLDPSSFVASRIILAMIAIPEAIGLLRYLSFVKSLGELVIMLKAMLKQIGAFIVLYLISITGFGVFFRGLFYGSRSFISSSSTFLQLVSFSLSASIDSTIFDTGTPWVNNLGIVFNVLFEVMTAILLVNLLIALMSNSFQEVSSNALKEWYFLRAKTLSGHKMLCEKNVLNMLPAPLNIITILVAPFHYYSLYRDSATESERISLAGTVANYTLFILSATIRLPIIVLFALKRLVSFLLTARSWADYNTLIRTVTSVFKNGCPVYLQSSMIDRVKNKSGKFVEARLEP